MEPIDMPRIAGAPEETPDRERLDELRTCFACGASLAPEGDRAMVVAEGIVLCASCVARDEELDEAAETRRVPPWFEDLTGSEHHT